MKRNETARWPQLAVTEKIEPREGDFRRSVGVFLLLLFLFGVVSLHSRTFK